MFKKLALVLTAMIFAATVAACGGAPSQPWDGTWKADGYVATVQNQTIEVHIVNDKTDALFWKGTFKPSSDIVSNEEIASSADKAALQKALLGSQDDTKTFSSKDGKLTFNISMMGVKRTVELTK
jgi:hypothetical protein